MSEYMFATALLIDDNDIDRFIHSKLLVHHKICERVEHCSNAREALSFLESCKSNEVPKLILLDLMMPEMDGFGFLEHYTKMVKKFDVVPKLFMVSSTEDDSDMRRARKSEHIVRLLQKPLSPVLLKAYIKGHQEP